jgi:hypothetical protein
MVTVDDGDVRHQPLIENGMKRRAVVDRVLRHPPDAGASCRS